jgi:tryptophan halogenase
MEPLESTSIHLIQTAIAWLMALFPDRRFLDTERDEFNRILKDKYEYIRNFIVLHYNATERDDSAFWNYCRTMEVPESLTRTIDLWRAKGRTYRESHDLFGITSWVAVLLGQHVRPDGYDPVADSLDENRVAAALEQLRQSYQQTAQALPTQREFLAQIMAPPAPPQPPSQPEPAPFDWSAPL